MGTGIDFDTLKKKVIQNDFSQITFISELLVQLETKRSSQVVSLDTSFLSKKQPCIIDEIIEKMYCIEFSHTSLLYAEILEKY